MQETFDFTLESHQRFVAFLRLLRVHLFRKIDMNLTARFFSLIGMLSLLTGCVPAENIHLYNATGEEIVIVHDISGESVMIAPNMSADFAPHYLPGEHLVVRTSKRSWNYSFADFRIPPSLYQVHAFGLMRAFARIDGSGDIYILAPPRDHGGPQETTQPPGFPVKPRII